MAFNISAFGLIVLPKGWHAERIDSIAQFNPEQIDKNYPYEEIQYYDIANVDNGRMGIPEVLQLDKAPSRAKRIVKTNDTILSTVRPGNRGYAYIKEAPENLIVSTGFAVIRPNKCDPRFLYYLVTSNPIIDYLASIAEEKTAYPSVNPDDIAECQVPVPPLAQQQKIADILGVLDDKIELNRRMNQTLEEMARAIFKSWFVDFEPVRTKAAVRREHPKWSNAQVSRAACPTLKPEIAELFPDEFEDSELGEIPKGWRVGRLENILTELVSGSRPRGGAVNKGVPSVGAENIIGLGKYDFSKEKFVPKEFFDALKTKGADIRSGDVLLYKDGAQIGRKTYFDCKFPHAQCAINEHVFIIRCRHKWMQLYLYFWLDLPEITNEIINLNSNSAQPGINQIGVRNISVLSPSDLVVQAFDQIAKPMLFSVFTNCHETRTLAALRDTLLPKLVSGELRVKA